MELGIKICGKEIIINDKYCWACGCKFSADHKSGDFKTMHHTLPRHLLPSRNVVMPVCKSCHERINEFDAKSIFPFMFKIWKTTEDLGDMLGVMHKKVSAAVKMKGGKSHERKE